jgi:predicted Fe-Mo cluster-binding NifX family protein
MEQRILIPLYGDQVAPRFDLATEVFIFSITDKGRLVEEKTVVLPRASAEQLCHLVLLEKIDTVVCGGIEDEYYQYLRWKHIKVMDSVIGSCRAVIERFCSERLEAGDILFGE